MMALAIVAHLSAVSAEQSVNEATKQVAAPPADFAQLALPNPAEEGTKSHSAMIPVHLSEGKEGWSWTSEIDMDSREEVSLMVFAPQGEQWSVAVNWPSGTALQLSADAVSEAFMHQASTISLGENGYPADVYRFAQAEAGRWTVQVTAPEHTAKGNGLAGAPDGYLVLSGQSNYQLYTHLNTYNLLVGNTIGLETSLYNAEKQGEGVPTPLAGAIETAVMVVSGPDGEQTITMNPSQQEGVFSGLFQAKAAGTYVAQVTVTGTTPEGQAFIRTSEHTFPVLTPSVTLLNSPVQTAVNDNTLQLAIPVSLPSETTNHVQISAEVWGQNASGQMVPVVWLSRMALPEVGKGGQATLPLSIDGRWLALAQTTKGLELRNVRVQSADTHIPLSQQNTMALQVSKLPETAVSQVTAVTEEMLMGPRPAGLNANASNAGVLMLVHGYCSYGVWPVNDFTQAAVFEDYIQNRTHDQFAQLIRNFGNQFSSFGIVAHSQGGDAALQLYTYYWSGLDNSSGSRRIQSVGTPYQGTPLAGNLAVLGQIFNVGCGTNFDLTYDGSALWLSGIPNWARAQVYYSTTSFTDVWWQYDYCQIVSDPFLSDPDDGVTEKWADQLPGGNNLGHKTGWCHGIYMRDPAQHYDHARNAQMNTYGNR